jgi:hypothetical protein
MWVLEAERKYQQNNMGVKLSVFKLWSPKAKQDELRQGPFSEVAAKCDHKALGYDQVS